MCLGVTKMGMGDRKEHYVPPYTKVRCDVTEKTFPQIMVRECPNRRVIARYGTGGIARVCMYVCKKCVFCIKYEHFGGVGCGYGLEL